MEASFQPGDILGEYEIVRLLGAGGMGEVYLVRHTALNVFRAMKILHAGIVGAAAMRFEREGRLAAAIHHKNVVSVLSSVNDPLSGMAYIVMEYVDGMSLKNYLQEHPDLSVKDSLHIITEAAAGLKAIAGLDIVHRDIKPGNIMISKNGDIKIADLGIARISSDSRLAAADVTLTLSGAVMGTPRYASPEQCCNSHNVDGRADIYSLGVCLYEMLTHISPFEADSSFLEVEKVLKLNPSDPRSMNPKIPQELSNLTMRMIAKDPKDRPANAAILYDELSALLQKIDPKKNKPQRSLPDFSFVNFRFIINSIVVFFAAILILFPGCFFDFDSYKRYLNREKDLPEPWETRINPEDKRLLLLFCGSGWSESSRYMKNSVMNSPQLLELIKKENLSPVYLEITKKRVCNYDHQMNALNLAEKYKIEKKLPCTVLVLREGYEEFSMIFYGAFPTEEYCRRITDLLHKKHKE